MEVYLGKIYMPIVFGDAAPSVPSFIGSKVIFSWISKLCALCRSHFLTHFFGMLYDFGDAAPSVDNSLWHWRRSLRHPFVWGGGGGGGSLSILRTKG